MGVLCHWPTTCPRRATLHHPQMIHISQCLRFLWWSFRVQMEIQLHVPSTCFVFLPCTQLPSKHLPPKKAHLVSAVKPLLFRHTRRFPVKHVAAVFLSLCLPVRRLANFKQRGREEKKFLLYWCLNDKPSWRGGTERRRARADTADCPRACIMHTGGGHTPNPSHLPRYQNTVSPDKIGWVRAWRVFFFFTLQLSVTFLSKLHVVPYRDKEIPKEPTCHPLPSPSLCLSLSPPLFLPVHPPLSFSAGYRRMEREYWAEVNIACCIIIHFPL